MKLKTPRRFRNFGNKRDGKKSRGDRIQKNVSENDIFVAIRGYKTDGHIYIESAKKRGCYACIVEDLLATKLKVKNSTSSTLKFLIIIMETK